MSKYFHYTAFKYHLKLTMADRITAPWAADSRRQPKHSQDLHVGEFVAYQF